MVEPHFGTLPPSPPASIEEEKEFRFPSTQRTARSKPEASYQPDTGLPRPFVPEKLHRASTDTKISLSTITTSPGRTPRLSNHSDRSDDSGVAQSQEDTPNTETSSTFPGPSSNTAVTQSPDGHLQPPQLARPTRRNTTGSAPRPANVSLHNQHGYGSQPFVYEEDDVDVVLASDIQQQADQIRRERNSKRVKAQQEAEAVLTRTQSMSRDGAQVLVGNLIGEDHVNYVLMYNMLTGIRIAVSRCQAKMTRTLTEEDFTAKHKFSFDITGNELTPSAKYDFKFKDYAPWVFRELREEYFHLDPADYLLSLTDKYILSELGSPGKSGSFFYFSCDYRFIIKTIRHSEAKFLLSVLPDYYAHVKSNPHTLLSRFYGLHRVKLPHGRKIHFVIMNNLFPPHRDIHETYDLKGSTVGREYPEEKAAENPRAVLKDLNWINRGRMLDFGPEKQALLTEQLRRDSELLKRINVMDYSLLVGIHNMQRGNRDNVRSNTLKVFSPDVPPMRRKPTAVKGSTSPEAMAMRRAMRQSDPKKFGPGSMSLPEQDTRDRESLIFYQDEGGLRATDEANEMMDTIYYLGVIDILTPYSVVKKLEHFWKGLSADRHKISPVKPAEYGDRFFSFMKAIMRGGGGAESFKPES
ncbi:SAICAR synthase-like protein [Athelia psychrophila]|uniref:1-phosphatidylinositol-4-phosphate 5-kinase n=1 Tax=Athelia psychrophila TaxID=1759441 RepID=A0A166QAX6_9AGAM|nr:SAICAR synthase-like protein [Fibularhizoctonia sp. CBS 109695]